MTQEKEKPTLIGMKVKLQWKAKYFSLHHVHEYLSLSACEESQSGLLEGSVERCSRPTGRRPRFRELCGIAVNSELAMAGVGRA